MALLSGMKIPALALCLLKNALSSVFNSGLFLRIVQAISPPSLTTRSVRGTALGKILVHIVAS